MTGLSWGASELGTPLRIHGNELEACARTVARVAIEQGVTIHAMQPVVPSTPEINAATAGSGVGRAPPSRVREHR